MNVKRVNPPLTLPGVPGPRNWMVRELDRTKRYRRKKCQCNDAQFYSGILIDCFLAQFLLERFHQAAGYRDKDPQSNTRQSSDNTAAESVEGLEEPEVSRTSQRNQWSQII